MRTLDPPGRCDVAVVGAGIVGLAVARALRNRARDLSICVLEKEQEIGLHQTSHNSGVIHAGIYYEPGSLKARLCVEGARELYDFCERHGVEFDRCGKLVVAVDENEVARLDELERRGKANGVPGLRRLDADGLRELEPHAGGVAALHSPATGTVDFAAVARAMVRDLEQQAVDVHTGCSVTGARPTARALRIVHDRGVTEVGFAVFCAGAWSDRMAVRAGADRDPAIVPFRGAYLKLKKERRALVRGHVYPVPDPALPFLGIHLTRHVSGDVLVGPSALLAPARLATTLTWPGTWRMARRWWRTGWTELGYAANRSRFVRAAARLVPELTPADVEPAFTGVRAQAVSRAGVLLDDFAFSRTERALHVRNSPSPAATSALAIGRAVAEMADGLR